MPPGDEHRTGARIASWGLAICFLVRGGAPTFGDELLKDVAAPSDTNSTVITSTRLSFDQAKRMAIFNDHVVVADPHVKITSNRLTVLFAADNKVASIEAQGNVVIRQGERKATGDKAVYEVNEGKVVMSGSPVVQSGRDQLSADTITFWRGSNRILCEPNARLVIRSEQDVFKKGLMKE